MGWRLLRQVIHGSGANTTQCEWRQGLHLSYVAGGLAPEMRGQGVVSVDDAARLS